MALPQDGWLAVALDDGSEGYTRNGAIEVDQDGALSVNGRPLMGDGGPLEVPPQSHVTIGSDGTVSALGMGDDPTMLVPVGRLKLVNADRTVHGDDGLFRTAGGEMLARMKPCV